MSSDRLLDHKQFVMALNGTPTHVATLELDGAGTVVDYEADSEASQLFMLQLTVGAVAWVSVLDTDVIDGSNSPDVYGVRMVLGDKLMVMTQKDKPFIVAIDNGAAAQLRIFRMS